MMGNRTELFWLHSISKLYSSSIKLPHHNLYRWIQAYFGKCYYKGKFKTYLFQGRTAYNRDNALNFTIDQYYCLKRNIVPQKHDLQWVRVSPSYPRLQKMNLSLPTFVRMLLVPWVT